MKIKLNYWQTSILFIPFLVGCIISDLPHTDLHAYHKHFLISNFLTVLNILIALSYQAYSVISFNNNVLNKSRIYVANALTPVIFYFLYLLYIIYHTFINPVMNSHNAPGPLRLQQINIGGIFILLFTFHAAITFFFISNNFISKRIKMISSVTEQEILKMNYLIPMRNLVRVSIFVFLLAIAISIIIDLVHFRL
jgi:hypothetical protein